jgi:hypothetical protein
VEEVDRRILAFVGAHRFVVDAQLERQVGLEEIELAERITALAARGFVRRERLFPGGGGFVRITGAGLGAIGSRMPAPGFDLAGYRHEVVVVWFWMAALRGVLGEAERVLSRREMQMLDRAAREAGRGDGRFAVPAPAASAGVGSGLLYPDVMLVFAHRRVAVHLVTWPHRGLDVDGLFAGHAARPEVADTVLALVDDIGVGRRIEAAAGRAGMQERLRVQRVFGEGTALRSRAPGG